MTHPGAGPTVSVVIPAYNGEAWLPATLASLRDQTLTDWEAIVVDDCSPDNGRHLVAAWPDTRVRLLQMPANGGPVRARNAGVAVAKGRYIAGLDQDDLCRPDRLARQAAYMDADPGCALLGTQVEYLAGDTVTPSVYPPVTTPGLLTWLLQIENPLAWSSVMVRGSVARALDPFTRPDLLYAEDFDLYGRVLPLRHDRAPRRAAAPLSPARRRRIETLRRHDARECPRGADRATCRVAGRCSESGRADRHPPDGRRPGARPRDADRAGRSAWEIAGRVRRRRQTRPRDTRTNPLGNRATLGAGRARGGCARAR